MENRDRGALLRRRSSPQLVEGETVNIQDLSDPELKALIDLIYGLALRMTRDRTRATDVQQETLVLLMGTRRWDPAKQPSLERHALGIVCSLLSHEERAHETRVRTEEKVELDRRTLEGTGAPSPEDTAIEACELADEEALKAARLAELRRRLTGWPLELAILDRSHETLKPADLVESTKRPLAEVNAALARIRRHMRSMAFAKQIGNEEVAS